MVACITCHAAVDKACQMLGVRLFKVGFQPHTYEANVSAMERHITSNTILLYASAPNFPQGVIDPIDKLSRLAKRYSIGLHVDCCLGGFILPFLAKKGGYDIPDFDFRLPGVTTMSVDTHKVRRLAYINACL